jgi:hypothetical protein
MCAREMTAIYIKGREILEINVLVHVIPYMVKEYQFDQYRNCNGQNREIES